MNSKAKNRKQKRKSALIEQLSPRVLYSADVFGFSNDFDTAEEADLPLSVLFTDEETKQRRTELVFVDTSVADYRQIIDSLTRTSQPQTDYIIHTIDSTQSIQDIDAVLVNHSTLSAIHFITHGTDANFRLGSSVVNNQTLQQYSDSFAQWGSSLNEQGDILFYGCNLAETEDGKQLVTDIAAATNADVGASDNRTGHESLNADWQLEFAVGTIDTDPSNMAAILNDWESQLQEIFVTTFDDVIDSTDGVTSLREAIILANTDYIADTIVLSSGSDYVLNRTPDASDPDGASPLVDDAYSGDLDITNPLTIIGDGDTVIDAQGNSRVLEIHNAGIVSLEQLELKNGNVLNGSNGDSGGAINSTANLQLNTVTISGSKAASGGAIYTTSTTDLYNVDFSGNTATNQGGGLFNSGVANISNSTFTGNKVLTGNGEGGGIFSDGEVYTYSTTFSGNDAIKGGGIFASGSVTTTTTHFISNSATVEGGAVFTTGNASIERSLLESNTALRGGGIANNATTTISDTSFSNNKASQYGSAVATLAGTTDIIRSTIADHDDGTDAALYNTATWNTVTVQDSIIVRNGTNINQHITSYGNNLTDTAHANWQTTDIQSATAAEVGLATDLTPAGDYAIGTYEITQDSVAINAGTPIGSNGVILDSTGAARNANVDIGAFEFRDGLVNNGPTVIENETVTVLIGGSQTIDFSSLYTIDPDTPPENIVYTMTPQFLDTEGTFVVSGTPKNTFTQAELNAGKVLFQHTGSLGEHKYHFTVSDGSTYLSTINEEFIVYATEPNETPTLDDTQDYVLNSLLLDDFTSSGTSIKDILQSTDGITSPHITDPNTDARTGIAVISAVESNGHWEYKSDATASWMPFQPATAALNTSNALLLDLNSLVRFVPEQGFADEATFDFKAHDWTPYPGDPVGSHVDIQILGFNNGGASSATTGIATIQVGALNTAPVLSDSQGSDVFHEENIPTTISPTLSLADLTDENLESASVQITGPHVAAEDQLTFTDTANIAGNYDSVAGLLTFTGTASKAEYEAALQSVQYNNTSDVPTVKANSLANEREITFTINDGQTDSNQIEKLIYILRQNDAPLLNNLDLTRPYAEGTTTPVPIAFNLLVGDPELDALNGGAGNYDGATFTVGRSTPNNPNDPPLQFFLSGAPLTTNVSYFAHAQNNANNTYRFASITADSNSGTLQVEFFESNFATPTTAQVSELLNAISFTNPAATASGTFSLDYTLNDGNSNFASLPQGFGSDLGSGFSVDQESTETITFDTSAPAQFEHVQPAQVETIEDIAYTFDGADNPANVLTIEDSSGKDYKLLTRIEVSNGTVALPANLIDVVSGNGTNVLVLEGLRTEINAALKELTYTPDPDFNSTDTLQTDTLKIESTVSADRALNLSFDNVVSGSNWTAVNGATITSNISSGYLNLNGDGAALEVQNDFGITNQATFAAWLETDGPTLTGSDEMQIILIDDLVSIYFDSSNSTLYGGYKTDLGYQWTSAAVDLLNNNIDTGVDRHHIAYSFDSTENIQALYFDGTLVAKTGYARDPLNSTASVMLVGADDTASDSGYFNGKMDDIQVFSRALNTAEIEAIHSQNIFDEGAVDIFVHAVNDLPILDPNTNNPNTLQYATNFTEGGGPVALTLAGATDVTDVDSTIARLDLSILNLQDGSDEILFANLPTGWSQTYSNGNLSITPNTAATPPTHGEWLSVIESLRYNNTSTDPGTTSRIIEMEITDSDNDANLPLAFTRIAVESVNNAPSINNSQLPDQTEDIPVANITNTATPNAAKIVDLLQAGYSDLDYNGDIFGIAVIDNPQNSAQGRWQYSNNGVDWFNINSVQSNNALLLGSDAYLKFYSAADFYGTPDPLTINAIDGEYSTSPLVTTDNDSRVTINTDIDLNNNFSASKTVSVDVLAVNDNPTLSTIEALPASYTENGPSIGITGNLSVADIDDTNIEYARVAITTGYISTEDELVASGTSANPFPSNITASFNPATGVMTLTGSASVADYEAAIRSIHYHNTSESPTTSPDKTVSIQVHDGDNSSNTLSRDISVVSINDAPITSDNSITTNEDTAYTIPFSDFSFSDIDNNTLLQVIVDANNPRLSVNNAAQTVTYTPDTNFNGPDFFTFQVQDDGGGSDTSASATMNVNVISINDKPVLTGVEQLPAIHVENGNATGVTGTVSIGDQDHSIIDYARAAITGNFISTEDTLEIDSALLPTGVTSSFNPATGVLTLTGPASVAEYQSAIKAIHYQNSSENPSTLDRVVSISVHDGEDSSNELSRTISVVAINDAPITNDSTLTTLEDTAYAIPFSAFPFSDAADANHNLLEVIVDTSDPRLSIDQLAKTVTYTPAIHFNGMDSFDFQVVDDGGGSDTSTIATMNVDVIPVNDAPKLATIEAAPAIYIENDVNAIGITGNLTVADTDDTHIEYATITISGNHIAAEDLLVIDSTQLPSGITQSFDPIAGRLTLAGPATTAEYQAAIRSIGYQNTSNNPSTLDRTISISVNDNDDDSNILSRDISLIAVNDAPATNSKGSTTTPEDTAVIIPFTDFPFSDTGDANHNLLEIIVDSTDTRLSVDNNAQTATYTPPTDYTGTDTFTFKVRDDGGIDNSGQDTSTPAIMSVVVTAVNDSPSTANTSLPTVLEDSAPIGETVSALVDATIFEDIDSGNTLAGIAISNNPESVTNGQWQYALPGGPWQNINTSTDTVSSVNSLLLDKDTTLRFQPAADYHGAPESLEYRAIDSSYSGAFTTAALRITENTSSPATNSPFSNAAQIAASVSAVNDAPLILDAQLPTIDEDTILTNPQDIHTLFSPGYFDLDGAPAISGIAITENAAPDDEGVWQYSPDGIRWFNVNAVSNTAALVLDSNTLIKFNPASDFYGAPSDLKIHALDGTYTGMTSTSNDPADRVMVALSDLGNMASAQHAITTLINPVNDAPIALDATLPGIAEDSANPVGELLGTLLTAGITDIDTALNPAHNSIGVAITENNEPPQHGVWQYQSAGAPWENIGAVSTENARVLDMDTSLRFMPQLDYNGAPEPLKGHVIDSSFTGGTTGFIDAQLTGGNTPFSNQIELSTNVSAVNDAPIIANASLPAQNEDTTSPIKILDLFADQYSDVDTNEAIAGIAITHNPAIATQGTWQYSSDALSWQNINTVDDSNALVLSSESLLRFVPYGNFSGTPADLSIRAIDATYTGSFTTDNDSRTSLAVTDSSFTLSEEHNISIEVLPVNDAPQGTSGTVETTEDNPYTFTGTDFGFSDPVESHNFAALRIDTVTSAGALTLDELPVSAGQLISITDINSGELVYTPLQDQNGAPVDAFNFTVLDNGGIARGGIDSDPQPNTLSINVSPVNDAPQGSNGFIAVTGGAPVVLSSQDFGFTDLKDNNSLLGITVESIPTSGDLTINGISVVDGQQISVSQINAGQLSYVAPLNGNYYQSSLIFRVVDNGGVANGGLDTAINSNTLDFGVTPPPNTPPESSDVRVTLDEDNSVQLSASDFAFEDPADGHGLSSILIVNTPQQGELTHDNNPVTAGTVITAADISGLLYTPAPSGYGQAYASLDFQVTDNGTVAGGGWHTSVDINTLTFDVRPVNDAPSGTDTVLTTDESSTIQFTPEDFGFSDETDQNNFQSVVFSSIPLTGELFNGATSVNPNDVIAVSDIANGAVTYVPAPVEDAASAEFDFKVIDDGGTLNNGQDTAVTSNTLTIEILTDNNPPTGADRTIELPEDGTETLYASAFGFADALDGHSFSGVLFTKTPSSGTLRNDGNTIEDNTFIDISDINAGDITYVPTPDENGAGYAEIEFKVIDNGSTTSGKQLATEASTLTFDVTPVNDTPTPPVVDGNLEVAEHVQDNIQENVGGQFIGNVLFNDADSHDTHELHVSDDRFEIIDGALALKPGASLDFESQPLVPLQITVTDSNGAAATSDVNLQILNVNEPPQQSGEINQQTDEAPFEFSLPDSLFTDIDGDELVLAATLDNGLPLPEWLTFDASTGQFSVANTAPPEQVAVVVSATDPDGLSASIPVDISIQPPFQAAEPLVNQNPVIDLPEVQTTPEATQEIVEPERVAAAPKEDQPTTDDSVKGEGSSELFDASTIAISTESDLEKLVSEVVQLNTSDILRRNLLASRDDLGASLTPENNTAIYNGAYQSQQHSKQSIEHANVLENLANEAEKRQNDIQNSQVLTTKVLATSVTLSSGFSVGYILWLLRGGTLLASVMASMPAWRAIDPLPILESLTSDDENDTETLESMVEEAESEDENPEEPAKQR